MRKQENEALLLGIPLAGGPYLFRQAMLACIDLSLGSNITSNSASAANFQD